MIDDPGSFSGNESSPSPLLGPLPKNQISLAILNKETDKVFNAPLKCTRASLEAKASNLFGFGMNLNPVSFFKYYAIFRSKPSNVLRPVPTAVPPWAISSTFGKASLTLSNPFFNYATYPENSWPSVKGVASWVWVQPILMIFSNSFDLSSND